MGFKQCDFVAMQLTRADANEILPANQPVNAGFDEVSLFWSCLFGNEEVVVGNDDHLRHQLGGVVGCGLPS